jgi:hypothetical protein
MVEGIMVAGTVEGIMVEDIVAADIMAADIMAADIVAEGIMAADIMAADIMAADIMAAMHALMPPMPPIIARLTTGQRTIIGMDATPSALTPTGIIGGVIGITGAGVGPISGAMC